MERNFIQQNIVDSPDVDKEYYIWDRVIGPIDADLVRVIAVNGDVATIQSLTRLGAAEFSVNIPAIAWEWDQAGAEGSDAIDAEFD